jgi:cell division protease FtsH
MAGGYTMSLPEYDKSFVSKSEMEENIVTLLGGRVAEKLILNDISTGASNDIERATNIARSMVTKYGFSENLGPMVYGNSQGEVFLGRDFNSTPNYSDNVAYEIDNEMRQIIDVGYNKAEQILTDHMDKLHFLAKYLIKYEKIDGKLFEKVMNGEVGEEIMLAEPKDKKPPVIEEKSQEVNEVKLESAEPVKVEEVPTQDPTNED